jgi:hypothetical protein
MRKGVILGLVCFILLVLPVTVRAQSTPTLENLQIQLWPDYDKAAVLVIYDFSVSAETALPAEMSLRLPSGAQLLAVAKDENNKLVTIDYQPPVRQGIYDVLSFSVADRATQHVEFYLPYTREGNVRSFSFAWPGDYAVKTATVRFQQPVDATDVKIEPAFSTTGQKQDGLLYYDKALGALAAGQVSLFKVSYQKPTDSLSVSLLGVQPTAPLDQPVSGQASLTSFLPWFLGGLGVLLIVGGGTWYWLAGRSMKAPTRSRRRHTNRSDEADGSTTVYCAQCGKRTQPGDRFCRTCGARVKQGETD